MKITILVLAAIAIGFFYWVGHQSSDLVVSQVCSNFEYSSWSDCTASDSQSRTIINALPDGCVGGSPTLIQGCDYKLTEDSKESDMGPKWDYVSLTPEIFKGIIQKIKSAPNAEMEVSSSGEQASATFHYSFVAQDPCEPSLKDFMVLEVKTTTYVDENGEKYPNGPVADYYAMRDTDNDNFPEDYWIPGESNPSAKLCDKKELPLVEDTPDINNLLSLWEASMNYFATNLLK